MNMIFLFTDTITKPVFKVVQYVKNLAPKRQKHMTTKI